MTRLHALVLLQRTRWYPRCLDTGWMNATARQLKPTDFERLLRLYAKFEPKGAFMGLPPDTLAEIEKWLHGLNNDCEQFIVEIGDRAVGHSFLRVSHEKPEAEMGIFMHQDFRGLGLGRTLLLGMLNYGCKQLHLDRVWVKIDNSNSFGREVLERLGFYAHDFNDVVKMELEMERPSNCTKCKGERCQVFGKPLPLTVAVRGIVSAYPDRPSPYFAVKKSRPR